MEAFETLDISGDAGIKAYGKSIEEVFVNSAVGMYSLITDLEGIEEVKHITVSCNSHSLEGLLVSWLNELIFFFDTYGFIGKKISVKGLDSDRLDAELWGEDFDPGRHEKRLLVKAATYHRLRVERIDDHWEAEVIFDI